MKRKCLVNQKVRSVFNSFQLDYDSRLRLAYGSVGTHFATVDAAEMEAVYERI